MVVSLSKRDGKIYEGRIVGLKYPTTFQTGNFRNWINKSSVPFPAISVYQRWDWTCVSATALEKKSSLKIGIWSKTRLEYYSKKSNFISDRHQFSKKEPNFHWSCFWNSPFGWSMDISNYQRSVKFRMNLWGHRFSQNPNQKLQRFLPYPLINFQGRFRDKRWPHKIILNSTDL